MKAVLFLFLALPAFADQLVWDASPDPGIVNYVVYSQYGTNQFKKIGDAGNTTTFTLGTNWVGTRYQVTATTSAGLESVPSNTVTNQTVPNPKNLRIIISP